MNSKSQAGQDLFVRHVLANKRDGFFLEIGSNNPVEINNTYLLEKELGWWGLGCDNSEESKRAWDLFRITPFHCTDATKERHWLRNIRAIYEVYGRKNHEHPLLDYLSLDIDEGTLDCLKTLPLDRLKFRVITIETDEYRFPGRRDEMVAILKSHGYDVLCQDVCDQGLSFEIWAVDPLFVDMKLAEKFRRDKPTDWKEFFV